MASVPVREGAGTTVDKQAFSIVVWFCLALCTSAFCLRATVRIVCLRRLITEDYLMLFALAIFVTACVVIQVFLKDVYTLELVGQGLETPGPDFEDTVLRDLRANGIIIILCIVGIWSIKLNFLLFFRRLTRQVRIYLVLWWAAVVVVMGCGVANLSLAPFHCTFGTLESISTVCGADSAVVFGAAATKVGVALDVLSDFILIAFPVAILWRSKINMRQKILLTAIFSLELLTIAATVVRGSIFGAQFYKSLSNADPTDMDFIWMLFWQYMELVVSFIVACTASFRSLWSSREQKARDERYRLTNRPAGDDSPNHTIGSLGIRKNHSRIVEKRKGWDKFYDSVLETLNELEGTAPEPDPTEYTELAGITKTVHLTQRISSCATETRPAPAPTTSEAALAAYCYHEQTKRALRRGPSMRRKEGGAGSSTVDKEDVEDDGDNTTPERRFVSAL